MAHGDALVGHALHGAAMGANNKGGCGVCFPGEQRQGLSEDERLGVGWVRNRGTLRNETGDFHILTLL